MPTWQKFPDTVPEKFLKSGKQLVIGGFTLATESNKGGEWITVIAQYSKFKNSLLTKNFPIMTRSDTDKYPKWIVQGFVTIDNYPVIWKYWTEVPSLSFQEINK